MERASHPALAAGHEARCGFRFRHFREITSNWKYDRLDRAAFDPALHERDRDLVAHFELLDAPMQEAGADPAG